MTEGTASFTEAEWRTWPPGSSCRISALSASTRPTARRRATVVSGSYVMLSSSTLRKATSVSGGPGLPGRPRLVWPEDAASANT